MNFLYPSFLLNNFLYGTEELPWSPSLRLRDGPESEADRTIYVNTTSYMTTVGRFANLSNAPIVSDFFAGNLDRSKGITDENGVTRAKLTAFYVGGEPPDGARFTISHYLAGNTDTDFAYRAFVWGTTGFTLSPQTTFVWDALGQLTIEDGSIRPNDEDFDFISSSWIQPINEEILSPIIDPYNIGQTVELKFGYDTKDIWDATHIGDVYTHSDFINFGNPNYVFTDIASAVAGSIGAAAAYSIAVAGLVELISESGAVTYTHQGQDIIYGSYNDDVLNYDSHIGTLTGTDPNLTGAYFVAGEGNDTVTGGIHNDIIDGGNGDDVLSGGGGSDSFSAGDGNDIIYTEGNDVGGYVSAGSGDDLIVAGGSYDNIYGGSGDDTVIVLAQESLIYGEDGNDTIFVTNVENGGYIEIEGSDPGDRLIWNGYEIGDFSAYILDSEYIVSGYDGDGDPIITDYSWIGYSNELGFSFTYGDREVYQDPYDPNYDPEAGPTYTPYLMIQTPNSSIITIFDYEDGDFGISLVGPTSGEVLDMSEDDYPGIPRTSVVFDGIEQQFEGGLLSDEALFAIVNHGPVPMPEYIFA